MSGILVVDDEREMCRMISSILKVHGFRVDKAYDAGQAIRKITARSYDLMVLDYELSDTNGLTVLAEVRRSRPSLKVVMISAHGSRRIKTMVKKFGVYRFLDKPFDLKRLIKVVNNALTERAGRG